MLRLHSQDINTSEYFDYIWTIEGIHQYDTVRLKALCNRFKPKHKVVELGAGVLGTVQFAVAELHMDLEAHIVDFSKVALKKACEYAPSLIPWCEDALKTHFEDDYFDVVVSGELIEHLETPSDLAKEMSRICKPGGYLVISTVDPTCLDAIAHGDYPEHLWQFEVSELKEIFEPFGVVNYKLVGDYHVIECHKSL